MKLGLKTNCFNDKSWEETLDILLEKGIEAVEPVAGGYNGKAHCNPEEILNDPGAIKRFNNAALSRKIEITALAVHGNPLHPDRKYSEEHIADLLNAIKLAGIIGVKAVTCFGGCPGASQNAMEPNWITCPFPPYFSEYIKWQWKERVIPFWKKAAKKAEESKVYLAIEMHPGDVIYNPELLLKLRESVDSEYIACNFDPSHLFWQGIDPVVCIKKLNKAIVHVHAKDCKVENDIVSYRGVNDWKDYSDISNRAWNFRTCGYGHGMEFWNDFVSKLRTIGYDWVLSIEHEDPLMSVNEGLEKTIKFLNDILLHEAVGKMWWEI